MRPSKLIEYWSTRPLDKNKFFNMIHRDYKVVFTLGRRYAPADRVQESQLRLLKDFLYQSNGQRPAIVEFSADDDSGLHGAIEYLIYYSHDTGWPLVASRIDTSFNPLAPLDSNPRYNFITSDMTRSQRKQLWDNEAYTGISSYGEGDEGQLPGIEIEFERFMVTVFEDEDQWDTTQYSLREFLQDSQIQYDAGIYGYAYDKVSAYLQLEYTGLKDYSILNHPGGIP